MQGGTGLTPLAQTDGEDSLDRSDSAMLDSRPSGPLIQDPSGIYTYASGAPLNHKTFCSTCLLVYNMLHFLVCPAAYSSVHMPI